MKHSNTENEPLKKLEQLWTKMEPDFKPFNREVSVADNPISEFTYYVEMGKYPPPEIMVELMEAFLKYFESDGDISLEEAFFGSPHSKRKSISYKQNYFLRHADFEVFIFEGDFCSLNDAAEKFLADRPEETDQDSFLRDYRRWKSKRKD